MTQRNGLHKGFFITPSNCAYTLLLLFMASIAWSQQAAPSPSQNADVDNVSTDSLTAAVKALQQQVLELKSAVDDVRSEAAEYRAEAAELRRELEVNRAGNSADRSAAATLAASASPDVHSKPLNPTATSEPLDRRVASLEDASTLLSGKVDEQHQIKIESGSKYKVRLSGIVLMNLFGNLGSVDSQDIPSYAAPRSTYGSNGTFGATLRQSEFGLEIFGPEIAGAKTSGSVQADFSGGFANTFIGVNYGLVRLRTASMRLDWKNTSLIAGQDSLFISPQSPTSFASLSIPAFGYAGNLWGWIPQVRVEHRFDLSDSQRITLQAGILDNLSGEPPYSSFDRLAQAGEKSAQPAYAMRAGWSHIIHGLPLSFGVAGFYSRQNWGFNRGIDAWSGMADWNVPIISRLSLSGELYRGRAIGGLGGGIGQSVLYNGDPRDPATNIRGLNSIGGWSQLKFKPIDKLEFNGAFGLDNPLSRDFFTGDLSLYGPALQQNRNALLNFILRPRSNVLFSAEYRHLRTQQAYGYNSSAEQFNLMMGVLF